MGRRLHSDFCLGDAQKRTVREPALLALFQVSHAVVNGGHSKGKSGENWALEDPQVFSLTVSALAISYNVLLGRRAKR